jgi:hypothetical protein
MPLQTPSAAGIGTLVRNTSGTTRFYDYLREQGKELQDGETYLVPGDLATACARISDVAYEALQRDLTNGDLEIVRSQDLHLYDSQRQVTQVLALKNEELGVIDPGWDAGGSSTFDAITS